MDYRPNRDDIGRVMVIGGYEVERAKIPEIFTENIKHALWLYDRYKVFGWPFNLSWLEQPAYIFDIISTCEDEAQKLKANGK